MVANTAAHSSPKQTTKHQHAVPVLLPLHSTELEEGKALITLLEGEGLQVPNLARKDSILCS